MASLQFLDPQKLTAQHLQESLREAVPQRHYSTGQKVALIGVFGAAAVTLLAVLVVTAAVGIFGLIVHDMIQAEKQAHPASYERGAPPARSGYGPLDDGVPASTPSDSVSITIDPAPILPLKELPDATRLRRGA